MFRQSGAGPLPSGFQHSAMPKLTKAKLNKYRRMLLNILRDLGVKLEHMEDAVLRGDADTNPDEVDEFGADTYRQEYQLELLEKEGEILADVQAALKRIEEGTFGICESCEKPIPERRLAVRPFARFCVACQRAVESGDASDVA